MHQLGEFARKWAHPFPGFSYSQKPFKCFKVLIKGGVGGHPHILSKTKNSNKKTYKKNRCPNGAGISSMQSPQQPTVVIVGHYIKLKQAKKQLFSYFFFCRYLGNLTFIFNYIK